MNPNLWRFLEEMLDTNTATLDSVKRRYPRDLDTWMVLRKRNGRGCALARGLLKVIIYNEKNNSQFINNLQTRNWDIDPWTHS